MSTSNLSGPSVGAKQRELTKLALLIGLGLLIRLAALPFSMTVDADAVSRVFNAWRWLSNPEIITHGTWGPLHTYLIAGTIWFSEDRVIPPILLSIAFSVATVIPMYFFTKKEFGEGASLFVSCVYLFYPVAVRNSLMAVSEVPFVLFVGLSLPLLSMSRHENGSWKHALGAGLALTLAAMLRYEAWVLSPLMWTLLWKKPRLLAVFVASSMLFPIFWMLGNQAYYGDALYSMHETEHFALVLEGSNDELTVATMIERIVRYPAALLFGLTPLIAAMSVVGAALSLIRRKKHAIWLIPSIGLTVAQFMKTLDGSIFSRPRYGLVLGMLLIPFSAEIFNRVTQETPRRMLAITVVCSMIPLSYLGRYSRLEPFIPNGIEAIPRLERSTEVLNVSEVISEQIDNGDGGLILDFLSWEDTFYIALMSRLHPDRIFIFPGLRHQELDLKRLEEFIDHYGTGVLLLKKGSQYPDVAGPLQSTLMINGFDRSVELDLLHETEGSVIYRYQVTPSGINQEATQSGAPRLDSLLRR